MIKAHRLAALLSAGAVAISLGTAAQAQAATGAASGPGAAGALAAACQPSDGTQPPAPPGNGTDFLNGVVAVSACNVWAVGARQVPGSELTLVEHWTGGRSWTVVASPSPSDNSLAAGLQAVSAVSASDIWAVGSYAASGTGRPLILHWDGASWTQLTIPGNFTLNGVTAQSGSDAWAVGKLDSGTSATVILHWDGTSWTQVPSPGVPGATSTVLTSVTATSASNAWAVGYLFGSSRFQPLILHWDGTSWTQVTSPDPDPDTGSGGITLLTGVTATSATDAWAVDTTNALGATVTLHWDGTSWTVIPSPDPGDPELLHELSGVTATSASNAWAAAPGSAVAIWIGRKSPNHLCPPG